jgi:hypothetical protein
MEDESEGEGGGRADEMPTDSGGRVGQKAVHGARHGQSAGDSVCKQRPASQASTPPQLKLAITR